MNFLQIAKKAARNCGLGGTGPATVVGQTGEAKKIVDWVNDAWMELQGLYTDWGWMRTSTSFVTVAAQASYTPTEAGATNFGTWELNTFRNYPTASGTDAEVEMYEISYQGWRDYYQFGSTRSATDQPQEFAIAPDKSICLGPISAAGYTVTADYFLCPTEMAADADEPTGLPSHYHNIIVWNVMMKYGMDHAAPEVYARGKQQYDILLGRLMSDYLPEVEIGGPLM